MLKTFILLLLITAGGVAYIASPVDVIPDCLPVVGWIDDLGVLGWVIKWWLRRQCRAIAINIFIVPGIIFLLSDAMFGEECAAVLTLIAVVWGYVATLRRFRPS